MLPVLLLMAIIPVLPKVEEKIGNPLSPYAVTKYVNELYAQVFAEFIWDGIDRVALFQYFWSQAKSQWTLCCCYPPFCKSVD